MQLNIEQIKDILKALGLLSFLIFSSCEVTKKAAKSKQDIEITSKIKEQKDITKEAKTVVERRQEGGSLVTDILPINQRPRDENGNLKELIETLKDGGLTKTIYYRPDGSTRVDCKTADLMETIVTTINENDKSNNERFENLESYIKAKESEKKEESKDSFIWAAMAAIVFVMFGGFFVVYKLVDSRVPKITSP